MNAESFKQRYLPFHAKMYRLAFRYTGSRKNAEDMVQETYLKLWNKRDELPELENTEAYVMTLLKNVCLDFLRRSHDDLWASSPPEDLQVMAEVPSSAALLEQKDEADCLHHLIEHLPPPQKKVILLRDVGDCSMEEIEQATGFTAANIRVLLSRARKKLREQFNRIRAYERVG